jgi:hypothetical protein
MTPRGASFPPSAVSARAVVARVLGVDESGRDWSSVPDAAWDAADARWRRDPAALRAFVRELDAADWSDVAPLGRREGDPALDAAIDRLLGLRRPALLSREEADWGGLAGVAGGQELDPTPTSYHRIHAAVRALDLGAEDVFYDLGAGWGRVVVYAALATDARARGVEVVGYRAAVARRAIGRYAISSARVVRGSAAAAGAFDDGTAFFLYDPFDGPTWSAVLARLRAIARLRPIRLLAHVFFPATDRRLAAARWLRPVRDVAGADLRLFDAGPPGEPRFSSRRPTGRSSA